MNGAIGKPERKTVNAMNKFCVRCGALLESPNANQMLCNKLEKFDRHDWKAILDQSIYAGWQDIYALKQDDQYEQSTEMEFPRL